MVFKTKQGYLTDYGLSCGYFEVTSLNSAQRVEMLKTYGCYHVRTIGLEQGTQWDSFDKLSEARSHYISKVKKIKDLFN